VYIARGGMRDAMAGGAYKTRERMVYAWRGNERGPGSAIVFHRCQRQSLHTDTDRPTDRRLGCQTSRDLSLESEIPDTHLHIARRIREEFLRESCIRNQSTDC